MTCHVMSNETYVRSEIPAAATGHSVGVARIIASHFTSWIVHHSALARKKYKGPAHVNE
jgi:hypothetical protein